MLLTISIWLSLINKWIDISLLLCLNIFECEYCLETSEVMFWKDRGLESCGIYSNEFQHIGRLNNTTEEFLGVISDIFNFNGLFGKIPENIIAKKVITLNGKFCGEYVSTDDTIKDGAICYNCLNKNTSSKNSSSKFIHIWAH